MYKRLLVVIVLGSIVLLGWISSPPQVDAQVSTRRVGFVRFAHTAIDVGPIDIYQGLSGQTPIVTNLAYGQFTDFQTLDATTTGFVARPAGSGPGGKLIFKLNWGVKSNESLVVIAAGLASNIEVIMEPISIVRNDMKGKARVRVVNMVWGTRLTVKSDQGLNLGQGLGPIGYSDHEVEPGTYTLQVTTSGGDVVATAASLALKADTAYTMVLAGGKDGKPPIQIMTLVSQQEITRVKIINKGAAAADIYIKHLGTLFAAGLASGAETDFVPMPSRDVTFVVRTAGSAPTSREMAAISTQLRPERDVTIVINPNRTMDIIREELTPPSAIPTPEATAEATAAATLIATPASS